jgi:hypothetical protein
LIDRIQSFLANEKVINLWLDFYKCLDLLSIPLALIFGFWLFRSIKKDKENKKWLQGEIQQILTVLDAFPGPESERIRNKLRNDLKARGIEIDDQGNLKD